MACVVGFQCGIGAKYCIDGRKIFTITKNYHFPWLRGGLGENKLTGINIVDSSFFVDIISS